MPKYPNTNAVMGNNFIVLWFAFKLILVSIGEIKEKEAGNWII